MIYLGADHGGYKLKEKIKKWLSEWGYDYKDSGNTSYDEKDDYPTFAFKVAQNVAKDEKSNKYPSPWKQRTKGILACRSAAGVVIAANKVESVRAFAAFDVIGAKHGREHNDANVLALSGDFLSEIAAREIVRVWLRTEFSGEERHVKRLKMIEEYEKTNNK